MSFQICKLCIFSFDFILAKCTCIVVPTHTLSYLYLFIRCHKFTSVLSYLHIHCHFLSVRQCHIQLSFVLSALTQSCIYCHFFQTLTFVYCATLSFLPKHCHCYRVLRHFNPFSIPYSTFCRPMYCTVWLILYFALSFYIFTHTLPYLLSNICLTICHVYQYFVMYLCLLLCHFYLSIVLSFCIFHVTLKCLIFLRSCDISDGIFLLPFT